MIHASRTNRYKVKVLERVECEKSQEALESAEVLTPVSGGRVSNTWVIYLKVGHNCSKEQLIPHVVWFRPKERASARFEMSPCPIS